MSARVNCLMSIALWTAVSALAPLSQVKAQTQDDFSSRRDKLIKMIESLYGRKDPSMSSDRKETMILTPIGRTVEVRITSIFVATRPPAYDDGKTHTLNFTLPGTYMYTFKASKGLGSRYLDLVSIYGKESRKDYEQAGRIPHDFSWNAGYFQEGVAEPLARALTDLNELFAEYARK